MKSLMKRLLPVSFLIIPVAAFAAVIVSSSTCSQLTFPAGSLVFIDEFKADVLGAATPAVACPICPSVPVVVGPLPCWKPSATSTNAYAFKGINENGTPIPAKGEWAKCP